VSALNALSITPIDVIHELEIYGQFWSKHNGNMRIFCVNVYSSTGLLKYFFFQVIFQVLKYFFFASNFLNFISLSPRLNSTNKFEFVLQNLYFYQSAYGLTNLIFTNRPTAWRTWFLPIGLRPEEHIFTKRPTAWRTYFYQSAYGLKNIFLPIPGYYIT
jgi:hypothetical protein